MHVDTPIYPSWACFHFLCCARCGLADGKAVLNIADNAVGSPQTVPLSGTGVTGVTCPLTSTSTDIRLYPFDSLFSCKRPVFCWVKLGCSQDGKEIIDLGDGIAGITVFLDLSS